MKTYRIQEKQGYPNSEEGVREMFANANPPIKIKTAEQIGTNVWGITYRDGSTTLAYPEFGEFEQPPISQTLESLAPLRDFKDVIDFLSGPKAGGSTRRPHLVAEWAFGLDACHADVFWQVVTQEWNSFDRIRHDEFQYLFQKFVDGAPPCDVPERMTVYRGQDKSAPKGLAWTLDRDVADGFAHGHRNINNPNPVVLEMEVTRDQVVFTCDDRNESEIVLWKIPA